LLFLSSAACSKAADLIIAKGQGNYETLVGASRPIFFLLKIKCAVFSRDARVAVWQSGVASAATIDSRHQM
jgi:uncharacterized protein with ATP-grasp and redox domains